jgi:hypothetical protein
MRTPKQTAEIIEKVSISVRKEVARRRKLDIYDKDEYNGIIYAYCKEYDCINLFDFILEILSERSMYSSKLWF